MFKRHFLSRRRYDAPALATAFAFLGLVDNLSKLLVGLFVFAGAYLVLSRHRTVARAPKAFCVALFVYGLATVTLSLVRGEPLAGNRQFGYGLIAMALAFLPMGLVLIESPLRAAVNGARIGIAATAGIAVVEYLLWGSRVGIGENPAIFAFVVTALGTLSRVDVATPARFLPNSRLWFYLSFLPVILSQTRAVWAVYGLALAFDALALLRRRSRATGSRKPLLVALALAAVVAVPGVQILNSGVQRGLAEFEAYSDDTRTETSIGIRMAMWRGAFEVISDHPLLGVGAMDRIDAVADRMPASAEVIRPFTHLHNLVLDEALSNGVLGLALMLAVFATFLIGLWRGTADQRLRETGFLLVFLVFNFGFFHGVMLHETTLVTIYAALGVVLVEVRRRERRSNRRMIAGGAAPGPGHSGNIARGGVARAGPPPV